MMRLGAALKMAALMLSLVPGSIVSAEALSQAAEPGIHPETVIEEVARDFGQLDFAPRIELAVQAMVADAVTLLEQNGFEADARMTALEWTALSTQGGLSRDLGDHAPMLEWLSKLYQLVKARLSADLIKSMHLDDIRIVNYAIPVVFTPRYWEIQEYRLHFVPLSAAAAYWGTNSACKAVMGGPLGTLCRVMAEGSRYLMARWVAPDLSDRVYLTATGQLPIPGADTGPKAQ